MSTKDKEKWDAKYSAGAFESRQYPSIYLAEHLTDITRGLESAGISPPWRALDIACGAGRNTHYLSAEGFVVDAVDISSTGLERAAQKAPETAATVSWIQYDLERGLPENLTDYHLIIMMRYVNLPLLSTLEPKLLPGGYIICEEHMRTELMVNGPKNPNFRVAPGQLAHALVEQSNSKLQVEQLSEGEITDPDGEAAAVARILVRKPA